MKNNTSHKYILRIIDHSMIYVAIWNVYTSLTNSCWRLVRMAGLLLLWGTTIWGILYKSISTHVNSKLSLIVYLVMGWVGIIFYL